MCDTLCVRHAAGMWFAKNSDRHPDEVQVVEWHPRRRAGHELRTQYLSIPDADAYAFLGSRPTWLWGCEHGVNEHGVAIGNEKIFTVDRPRAEPGALLGMDIVRLVLERARTADHALDICTTLVETYGQAGSGEPHAVEPYFSSFMIADARGGWIVETSDRTWVARETGSGASVSNRVSLRADWTRASDDVDPATDFDRYRHPGAPVARADHRLAVTAACVARGDDVDLRHIAATLRDHGAARGIPRAGDPGDGFTVCMHRPERHAQTTASMIIELRADAPTRAWTCLGNPCVSVFVPCVPPNVAPEVGDPAQWQRFAHLRDRVEADPGALAAVRAVLDPVEAELWTTPEPAGGSPVFTSVDAALRRLGA